MSVQHSSITGADNHEPKGVESAATGTVYTADGAGSGVWSTPATIAGLGTMSVQNAVSVVITGGSITGITDLAIADGGTGASNAVNARLNLGLGTSSIVDIGTSGATVPLLSTANTWTLANTFSAGINGVTTNSSAAAGVIGEYISSSVASGSGVSMTTTVNNTITSISLTAGDWIVHGNVGITAGVGAIVGLGLVGPLVNDNTNLPNSPNGGAFLSYSTTAGQSLTLPWGMTRLSLSTTSTVYLRAYASFSGGTLALFGFIGARRVR